MKPIPPHDLHTNLFWQDGRWIEACFVPFELILKARHKLDTMADVLAWARHRADSSQVHSESHPEADFRVLSWEAMR